MGTTAEAAKNMEESEDDTISIICPPNFTISEALRPEIFEAFQLGVKELRMYMAFILIFSQRINGIDQTRHQRVNIKKLLGVGFQSESEFRKVRTRLERVNLLKVERNSLPGQRGGSHNTYTLLLLPTGGIRTGQSVFKDLYDKDTTITIKEKGNAKDKDKSFIREEGTTKNILNGVDDWEARPRAEKKHIRGSTTDPVETWNGAHRLNYFLDKYYASHNMQYILTAGRGVHERRIMDLPAANEVYRDFIDWLFDKRDLKSINFLPEQLNLYMRQNIVSPDKRREDAVKGEYFKLGGGQAVVHQYGGFAVVGKQILALDAIEAKLIDVAIVVEWDLCPRNVLARMGYIA